MKNLPNYSSSTVRIKGRKDSSSWRWGFWPFHKVKKPVFPALLQDEPPQYEQSILRAAEKDMNIESEHFQRLDLPLKTEYCQSLKHQEHCRHQFKKESDQLIPAERHYEQSRQHLQEMSSPELAQWIEVLILSFLLIIEYPFNAVIFSIFGASKAETYLMACITLLIPVAAYFWGRILKKEDKSLTEKILAFVLPAATFLFLTVIAILRGEMFGMVQKHTILKMDLTVSAATSIFVIMNLAVFIITMVVSFAASHKNPADFRTRSRRYKAALHQYRNDVEESEEAERNLQKADLRVIAAQHKRQKTHELYCERARTIKELAEQLVHEYRSANMEPRDTNEKPHCFKTDPREVEIPNNLLFDQLDWDCSLISGINEPSQKSA